MPSDRSHGRYLLSTTLAVALVAVAAGVFFVRTVWQPQYRPCDFSVYYTAGRGWLLGSDPYNRQATYDLWLAAGGRADIMPSDVREQGNEPWMPIVVLPPSFPVMAPLSAMPTRVAVPVWYIICSALLLAQTAALSVMIGSSLLRPAGLLLLAATLLLAPVHDNFGWAQPSSPTISLIILAMYAGMRGRELTCAVIVGLATALKPQLGGVFLVYYFLISGARFRIMSVALLALLSIVGLAPLWLRDTAWIAGWQENMHLAEAPGGFSSTSTENPGRSAMLNLNVVLNVVIHNRTAVNVLAVAITAALAVVLAWCRRKMRSHHELLSLSMLSILALLPVYHRFYDAALLVVPLAWGIAHFRSNPRDAAPILLVVATFLLPLRAHARLAQVFNVDAETASGFLWDFVLEPVRTWILLAGFLVLVRAARRNSTTPADSQVAPAT